MTKHPNNLLYELGYLPNKLGVVTQLMYWQEMVKEFGAEALVYALPFSFCVGGTGYSLLADDIQARKDDVTEEFNALIAGSYSWGSATSMLMATEPPSVEFINDTALELACRFHGRGMRYAIAHYLAPSRVTKNERYDHKSRMPDFTRTILSWNNSLSAEFKRLLTGEFAPYSKGVLDDYAFLGSGCSVSSTGVTIHVKAHSPVKSPSI